MNKIKKLKFLIYSGLILGSALIPSLGEAVCLTAQNALRQGDVEQARTLFTQCAVNENDEEAQFWLARFYQSVDHPTIKDTMKMLLFYHLAAENGNANAQVALAKILLKMDESETERNTLSSYLEQIQAAMKTKNMLFKGEILHPYVLLTLAAEGPEQKWYYPTLQKTNSEAQLILKTYQVPADKKAALLRAGSLWKQRKMQETAQEVLNVTEYNTFINTLYPKQGAADPYARQMAISGLKDRVEKYLK